MSWEDDSVDEEKCPCGKGTYSVTSSSDDWNRFRTSWTMNCTECKRNYRLFEFTYHRDGMGETGFRWVKTEIYDAAMAMIERGERMEESCLAKARAEYLEILVQQCNDLSRKEIWTKLSKGLRSFSSLGTFYKHTKGRDKRAYLADVFQYYPVPDVLRLIGVKNVALVASLQEAKKLKLDADKLLFGR